MCCSKDGDANLYKRCVSTAQNCLAHHSRWVINNYTYYDFFNNFLFHSQFLVCTRCIALKQQYVSHTNTNTPAMIPTYGKILSAIEKALWELIEEY